jgi:hypothetical protein
MEIEIVCNKCNSTLEVAAQGWFGDLKMEVAPCNYCAGVVALANMKQVD